MTEENKDYPSDHAMEAAVAIEIMVASGRYATVAYGRAIQKAIDATRADDVAALAALANR